LGAGVGLAIGFGIGAGVASLYWRSKMERVTKDQPILDDLKTQILSNFQKQTREEDS